MDSTLSEDIIYLLLHQVYYDEQVALPDYSTLTSLCLVNHAVSRPAQPLLFRWVRLLSICGISSFANACRRKPWLGRGAYIQHVRLGRATYSHGNQSVKAPDLVLPLSAVPKLRTLMLDIELPIVTMENRDLAPLAALPAACTISSLHLKAPTNTAMHLS
ncbi:hypothetical protein EXIGLDRAFT_762734 [Exidia glandulosa HHB12029]|uniref:Uncharacterized protein n=1 Tax=Exidia glandulosa HHB12029 TaxID=1314781 RepID=A0A165MFN0_EXIGL|nr:hypothetical protein EXIGLDRAFT_762734 [Exidia glandulosa HHB12029]